MCRLLSMHTCSMPTTWPSTATATEDTSLLSVRLPCRQLQGAPLRSRLPVLLPPRLVPLYMVKGKVSGRLAELEISEFWVRGSRQLNHNDGWHRLGAGALGSGVAVCGGPLCRRSSAGGIGAACCAARLLQLRGAEPLTPRCRRVCSGRRQSPSSRHAQTMATGICARCASRQRRCTVCPGRAQYADPSALAPRLAGTAAASAAGMALPARPWPRYADAPSGCVQRGCMPVVVCVCVSDALLPMTSGVDWHAGVRGHLVGDAAGLRGGLVPAVADANRIRHQGACACARLCKVCPALSRSATPRVKMTRCCR